jgi:hypothetical protein
VNEVVITVTILVIVVMLVLYILLAITWTPSRESAKMALQEVENALEAQRLPTASERSRFARAAKAVLKADAKVATEREKVADRLVANHCSSDPASQEATRLRKAANGARGRVRLLERLVSSLNVYEISGGDPDFKSLRNQLSELSASL